MRVSVHVRLQPLSPAACGPDEESFQFSTGKTVAAPVKLGWAAATGPACVAMHDDADLLFFILFFIFFCLRLVSAPRCFVSHICKFVQSINTRVSSLITLQHSRKNMPRLGFTQDNGHVCALRVCSSFLFFGGVGVWSLLKLTYLWS